ncbi:MAG TPA: permease-like cell division protein FtsX [Acidimicrobiia bacterium]|nr:permease-like cell division protein FtsX [Acidimicrobiia bacterium]
MSRFAFLVREALINLRRNLLVVLGAVLAVFISLSLAFGALVVNELLRINTLAWQEGVHVIAFLHDEGSDGVASGAHLALLEEVESWSEVANAFYVDKAGAWAEFRELFADRPEYLDIDPSVLPASIRIELTNIDLYRDVQFRLADQAQLIRRVETFGEQIEQLSSLSTVLNLLGLGLALVLGVSAVILIANTIRMAIYARRDEVSIMKLVGASNWFVRVPFLLEGMMEGRVGAGLAVGTVWVASRNLRTLGETIQLVSFSVSDRFFLTWGILILLFGAAAGVLGSVLGLSRYLRDDEGGRLATGARRVLEPT